MLGVTSKSSDFFVEEHKADTHIKDFDKDAPNSRLA
jgi:hypothetical protein